MMILNCELFNIHSDYSYFHNILIICLLFLVLSFFLRLPGRRMGRLFLWSSRTPAPGCPPTATASPPPTTDSSPSRKRYMTINWGYRWSRGSCQVKLLCFYHHISCYYLYVLLEGNIKTCLILNWNSSNWQWRTQTQFSLTAWSKFSKCWRCFLKSVAMATCCPLGFIVGGKDNSTAPQCWIGVQQAQHTNPGWDIHTHNTHQLSSTHNVISDQSKLF